VLFPGGAYKARVSELRRAIAANRPLPGKSAVRVPGDGSLQRRKQALAKGMVNIDEKVYRRILALCE
jgi:LDH2 family malate/lactate/ureidoglycolate dehydrogenase